jgi:hypothetical protein
MAVIKYEINGKANTKPVKDTEAAMQGMFKKVEDIDNKLKAFVGVKVFQEVGKAVKDSLAEYDKFKASINDSSETNISKQFKSLQTTLSGTLGTIRDEMTGIFDNIFGGEDNNFLTTLEEIIPKVGANLIASMSIVEKIVKNISTNFDELVKPETWNNFFEHANRLATEFGNFFSNVLKDVFSFAVDFFKWSFENMNLLKLLWTPFRLLFGKVTEFLEFLGSKLPAGIKNLIAPDNKETSPDMENFPAFDLSPETTKALDAFNIELGKTFNSFASTLAGTDVSAEFQQAFDAAFKKLEITINRMKNPQEGGGRTGEVDPFYGLSGGIDKVKKSVEGAEASMSLMDGVIQGITQSTGELGQVIQALMTGNIIGLIIMAISRLAQVFSNISEGASAIMNIVTVLFDTIQQIAVTIGPVLDAVFKPFVEVIAAIGRVVGSILTIVMPIIVMLNQFLNPLMWVLEPLAQLLNVIALAFAYVADAVGTVYNFISEVVKKLTFGFVKMGSMSTNNVDRMKDSQEAGVDYGKYQDNNNSTSYSVAGDQYIYITFSHSYVNGDARDIAIMMRDEIRSAEKSGY